MSIGGRAAGVKRQDSGFRKAFGMPKDQVPIIGQNLCEPFPELVLRVLVEIDHNIAAENHVEFPSHGPRRKQVEFAIANQITN